MKHVWALLVALMLVFSFGFTAVAEDAALAGTYVLDATPLGMPMSVYLLVDETNHFQLTNKLENGADKGNGQIGAQDGLYVMLYSDSTNESVKSATFTLDGVNMLFSTKVPYGSSSFSPNAEDPDNIIYPVAKKVIYTEYQGQYIGAVEVEAMGSTIVYNANLTLADGAEYTLNSSFVMGGTTYTYEQKGTFAIENDQITLTTEGKDAQTGTFSKNGIDANLFLSAMASSPRAISLKKATTAEVAGVYTAVKDMSNMGFVANVTLTLDAFGNYSYVSNINGQDELMVLGSFLVNGNKINLIADEGDPIICSLNNHMLTAKLRISTAVPMPTTISFYRDVVQGEFKAAGTDENGNEVSSVMTLNADGTYTIAVDHDGMTDYEEEGTFATEASMTGVSIVLTAADGTVSTGIVSNDGINITHNVDYMFNTLGFKYAK